MKTNRKRSSYREMLRNRLPMSADMALKWYKAKDKWIDHVYRKFIHVFADKSDRYEVTCLLLGIKKRGRKFIFERTIDWGGLNKDDHKLWIKVRSWEAWLNKNLINIIDDYKHAIRMGKLDRFKVDFIKNYLSALMPKPNSEDYERRLEHIDALATFVENYLEKIYKDHV